MEKISQLHLHQAVMIPQSAFTGTHLSDSKIKGLEIYWDSENGRIVLHYKGQTMYMPDTNVNIAVAEPSAATKGLDLATPLKTVRRSKGEPATI